MVICWNIECHHGCLRKNIGLIVFGINYYLLVQWIVIIHHTRLIITQLHTTTTTTTSSNVHDASLLQMI